MTCRDSQSAFRDWAAEQLDIDAAAAPAEARRAFLKALAAESFLPHPTWKPAFELLNGTGRAETLEPLQREFLLDYETELREEIDEFAAEFFALAPAARRLRYQELLEPARTLPVVHARLRRLEPGLNVERFAAEEVDPATLELANHVQDLFILPHVEAAARRHKLLDGWEFEMQRWESAAARLNELRPDVAALDKDLMRKLISWSTQKRRRIEAQSRSRSRSLPTSSAPAPAQENPLRYSWLVGVLVVGLVKAIAHIGGDNSSAPSRPTPSYQINSIDLNKFKIPDPLIFEKGGFKLHSELSRFKGESQRRERFKNRKRVAEFLDSKRIVVYGPTPPAVVDKMLDMARIKPGDRVCELGCGDARTLIAAARKYGVKAAGYDSDLDNIKEARKNVKENKVEELVTIEHKDIFTVDLSQVDVLFLYLLPEQIEKLHSQIARMPPGSRIVCHDFPIEGYRPKESMLIPEKHAKDLADEHEIFVYETPLVPGLLE